MANSPNEPKSNKWAVMPIGVLAVLIVAAVQRYPNASTVFDMAALSAVAAKQTVQPVVAAAAQLPPEPLPASKVEAPIEVAVPIHIAAVAHKAAVKKTRKGGQRAVIGLR